MSSQALCKRSLTHNIPKRQNVMYVSCNDNIVKNAEWFDDVCHYLKR